jgi:hypothetical protein
MQYNAFSGSSYNLVVPTQQIFSNTNTNNPNPNGSDVQEYF